MVTNTPSVVSSAAIYVGIVTLLLPILVVTGRGAHCLGVQGAWSDYIVFPIEFVIAPFSSAVSSLDYCCHPGHCLGQDRFDHVYLPELVYVA